MDMRSSLESVGMSNIIWGWDESPSCVVSPSNKYSVSAIAARERADSTSTCVSSSSSAFSACRSSSLAFAVGESARVEYSNSPRFCIDVSGDELDRLMQADGSDVSVVSMMSPSSNQGNDFISSDSVSDFSQSSRLTVPRWASSNGRVAGGGLGSFLPPSRTSGTMHRLPTSIPHRNMFPHQNHSATQLPVIHPLDLCTGEFDYQGIPWSRFSITRSEYRSKRIKEYTNYNNVNWNARLEFRRRMDIGKVSRADCHFFQFHKTYRNINPTIDHFQLRHLLWSTSAFESFYVSNSSIFAVNKQTLKIRKIHACSPQQLASCHVQYGLAVSGGFDSEVTVTNINGGGEFASNIDASLGVNDEDHQRGSQPGQRFSKKVSSVPNSITNHVCVLSTNRVLAANNDSFVTEFDVEKGSEISKFKWDCAVNHVSCSHNLLCLSGDSCEVVLVDNRDLGGGISCRSNASAIVLSGHLDFSFCSSWLSSSIVGNHSWSTLCTGSQDGTCRIWDIRKPNCPVSTLGSLLGAVRSAKFSSDGKWLAFSEPADFVHLYEVGSNFKKCQVIDCFGNIGGISFSPDSGTLSMAVSDTMFGCLIDFQVTSLPP